MNGDTANPGQMQRYLDIDYPATKDELVSRVREEGADETIISTLDKLPDRLYMSPADVNMELGGGAGNDTSSTSEDMM